MTQAEKSEKGHAFEGGTSGIQQAACEALNPVKDCGKMAFAEMRSPLSLLLQNPGLAVPATAKSVWAPLSLGFIQH